MVDLLVQIILAVAWYNSSIKNVGWVSCQFKTTSYKINESSI